MQLLISEKPSVAQAISKVLGVKTRKDGYIEFPLSDRGHGPRPPGTVRNRRGNPALCA